MTTGPETEEWLPVRISREAAATLFVRDKDGRRLTWDFGQPNADGFYTPTITTSEDDWYLALPEAGLSVSDNVGAPSEPEAEDRRDDAAAERVTAGKWK